MLEKRGCQPLVYPHNSPSATGEQSHFASSLICMLLMYNGAWKCRGVERSYNLAGIISPPVFSMAGFYCNIWAIGLDHWHSLMLAGERGIVTCYISKNTILNVGSLPHLSCPAIKESAKETTYQLVWTLLDVERAYFGRIVSRYPSTRLVANSLELLSTGNAEERAKNRDDIPGVCRTVSRDLLSEICHLHP